MFTGIIKQLGRVEKIETRPGGRRISVAPDSPLDSLEIGESIACNGVCLTVEPGSMEDNLGFFLSDETLKKTTFAEAKVGATLNLERSLAVGDRMGGHFVMGHVDCVGRIARLDRSGEAWDLEIEFPQSFGHLLAPKGSVAVDGISLTVVDLKPDRFTVAIIPHTYENTSLKGKSSGSPVNLEADLIARYVASRLGDAGSGGITKQLLEDAGFE